jgi:hypothetical protein
VRFEGTCPFVGCAKTYPHEHSTCPDCGAVRFGNMFCNTCVKTWDISPVMKMRLISANTERGTKIYPL